LARARVCMRALTAHGKRAPMSQATISPNVHQTFNIHLDALAQVAFDLALSFDHRTNAAQIVFAQILDTRIKIYIRLSQDRGRTRSANSVYSSKTDLRAFVGRKIDASYTSHYLSLSLFMLRIAADDAQHTL